MAATAQPAPTLEISVAADIMELHSDSGLDFGDGDIDLDLRSTGQQDDDLSLYDAGTDIGVDVQTASADQDDFMADNEDLIEEDEIDYEDDVVVDVDHHQSPAVSAPDQQPTANAEEDLIDYSDEEEQPDWNDDSNTHNAVDAETTLNEPTGDETAEQALAEEPYTTVDSASLEEPSHDYEYDVNHNLEETDNVPAQAWNDEDDHGDEPHAAGNNHDEYYADEHAASLEEQNNHLNEVTENEHTQDQTEVKSDFQDGTALHEQADQVSQECDLHPITINYDSAELWLFKHHDYDSSGDYLVESHSLATKPISNLLEACRAALGSDVADDMELGFRLDNFHNIELYQEHSSCAFVTLEHLVKLYLQLHTQDGISNPESFYMTLLFRPRVSALLSELNKAAAEGIGHTGLESAIAAGLTAFNIHLSHNSTEHIYEDWEGGEQQQNEESHDHEQDPSGEDEDHDGEHEQYDEEEGDDGEQQHEEHEEDHGKQNEEDHGENATEPQVHSQDDVAHAPLTGSADNTTTQGDANPASQTPVEQLQSNSQTPHQADDIIDYSDDEADAEDGEPGENDTHEPPSSSATVQGDDPASAQDGAQESAGQDNYTEDSGDATHGNYEGEAGEHFALHEDIETTYEGLDGIFGEEYNEDPEQVQEQEYAAMHELEEYAAEYSPQADDGNTNQYDDFEEQDVDQTADFSLVGFADDNDDNVAQSTTVDDTFTGADAFLDFDNAVPAADISVHDEVEGIARQDEIDYNDEDGAVGQAPVAASATADPVAASSSGLVELSPQGQKRTIDEVGNDVDEANDPSDAKRPRV